MWPAPRPATPAAPSIAPPKITVKEEPKALTPWQQSVRSVTTTSVGMGSMLGLGAVTSPAFMSMVNTLGLAGLVGFRAVWSVTPALHSPLMSVTNALSGLVGVGGLFAMGGGWMPMTFPQWLGALSVLLANLSE